MTAHVAGKYEKSWPGTGTYFDALHAHIMPYLSDYRRLPSVLARLKVIIDHEGGLEMSRAEWNEVNSAVWEIEGSSEEEPLDEDVVGEQKEMIPVGESGDSEPCSEETDDYAAEEDFCSRRRLIAPPDASEVDAVQFKAHPNLTT
jgi:hypothetical protein